MYLMCHAAVSSLLFSYAHRRNHTLLIFLLPANIQRYSLALTYDGANATVRTYRNGQEVGACQNFPYRPSGQPLSTSLFIGRSTHPRYPEYLDAEFKCFRMYNRALSAEEIVQDTCHAGLLGVATTAAASTTTAPAVVRKLAFVGSQPA